MRQWERVSRCAVTMAFFAVTAFGQTGSTERYSGMLPCADCSGIRTALTLLRDAQGAPSTFTMSETYVGRPAAGNPKTSGTWTVVHGDAADKSATVYQLHGSGSAGVTSLLRVDDNTLSLLDGSLGQLPASVPHTLRRVTASGNATVVTDKSAGDVSLKVGGALEVRLDANHTTGYSWIAAPVADPVLSRLGAATYKEDSSGGGKAGVGGVEIWRFKAVKTGKEALKFEYRRPWEKNVPAVKTVTFLVTVE
jgi:copper homeostasis protein (lipoprotein)